MLRGVLDNSRVSSTAGEAYTASQHRATGEGRICTNQHRSFRRAAGRQRVTFLGGGEQNGVDQVQEGAGSGEAFSTISSLPSWVS